MGFFAITRLSRECVRARVCTCMFCISLNRARDIFSHRCTFPLSFCYGHRARLFIRAKQFIISHRNSGLSYEVFDCYFVMPLYWIQSAHFQFYNTNLHQSGALFCVLCV